MKYAQLISWLSKNAVFQGHVRVIPSDNAIFIAMLVECRNANLLGSGSMHSDSEGEYIDYPLTSVGREIVLGIQAPDTAPTSEPQPVPSEQDSAAGYTTDGRFVLNADGERLTTFADPKDATESAQLLNDETQGLRDLMETVKHIHMQNADKLRAQNASLQERIGALEAVIQSAYDHSITASSELGYGNEEIAQEYILKTKAVLAEIANPDTED